jgi:ribose transport system ATP-binding protein
LGGEATVDGVDYISLMNISKKFGGTQALDDVSFNIRKGEIHALLGENGAGKSTLVKIISGAIPRDSGQIIFEGEPYNVKNPQQARLAGVNVVYQEFSLVSSLSVAENICASNEPMNTFRVMKLNQLNEEAKNILTKFNIDPNALVKNLGVGAQQMVEIAGAISRSCKLLVLDEPTASLTKDEVKELFKIISILKENEVTVIYITHKITEVFEIADRATVLKDGNYVATVNVKDVDENDIVKMMIGRDLTDMYPQKGVVSEEVVFEVVNYSGRCFKNVSFKIYQGEILGFAGLAGAGRTELFTSIFGFDQDNSGELFIMGKKLDIKNVKDAMKAGIGYLPEDRKSIGLFQEMNIKDNTIASILDDISNSGILSNAKINGKTIEMINKLNIKVNSIDDRILSLSGGNQQKVIVGRWLLVNPKVLIVDEPTRGIDVGAKFEIYQLLRNLATQGMSIVIISSELPEIMGMCDRVIVMYKGSIQREVDCAGVDLEQNIGCGIMGISLESENGGVVS